MRTLLKSMIAVVLIATGQFAVAKNQEPQALVESVTAEILQTLKENKSRLTTDEAFVVQKVDELIVPNMDLTAMGKLVLGKHWRDATPAQQKTFIEEFKRLLIRTYKTSLVEYQDQTVDFLPFRPSAQPDKLAVVRSEIKRAGGPPIPLNYSLRFKEEDGWKVYDIGIEGVSLVTNYRSSFSREITEKGIDALIASLKQRNEQKVTAEATE